MLKDFPCPTTPEACTNCGVSLSGRGYTLKGHRESPYAIHCGLCDSCVMPESMLNVKIMRYKEFLEEHGYKVEKHD